MSKKCLKYSQVPHKSACTNTIHCQKYSFGVLAEAIGGHFSLREAN